MNWPEQLDRDGFACVPDVLSAAECDELLAAFDHWRTTQPRLAGAGVRNLLRDLPTVGAIASGTAVQALATRVLGASAFPVRALWFDKTPAANWKVSWHQDLAIAVAARSEVPGYTGWSEKEGVLHVHPPSEVLMAMLTVRLHLDECGPEQGPLRVLPGSHRHGRLDADAIRRWRKEVPETACTMGKGAALVMRPLLLHASSAAVRPAHRRVLHLEFAAAELPGGLHWAFRPAST